MFTCKSVCYCKEEFNYLQNPLKRNVSVTSYSLFPSIYIVLNLTICMLIPLQYIRRIKILCWICFLNIRTDTFKGVVFDSLKISNCKWAVFINILVLKCGMYFRAAFNEINMVLVGKAWVNYAA